MLDVNRIIDKIAQAYTQTQRHISNIWKEMISRVFFLCRFFFFPLVHTNNMGKLIFPRPTLWPYSNFIVFHAYLIIYY